MARVSKKFVNETLWPEFEALQETLRDYFDEFTSRIIAEALDADPRDADDAEPRTVASPIIESIHTE